MYRTLGTWKNIKINTKIGPPRKVLPVEIKVHVWEICVHITPKHPTHCSHHITPKRVPLSQIPRLPWGHYIFVLTVHWKSNMTNIATVLYWIQSIVLLMFWCEYFNFVEITTLTSEYMTYFNISFSRKSKIL